MKKVINGTLYLFGIKDWQLAVLLFILMCSLIPVAFLIPRLKGEKHEKKHVRDFGQRQPVSDHTPQEHDIRGVRGYRDGERTTDF